MDTSKTMLLQVDGLGKAFGGVIAASDLSFAVGEGEIMGLIGPNGSGKTTTLNLISGQLRADTGRITMAGADVTVLPAHRRVRKRIARTFQLVRLAPSMTAHENVAAAALFGAERHGHAEAAEQAVSLLDYVGFEADPRQPGAQLTYIDQKRVELARALATSPRLLLLDEWLSGLNPTELRTGIDLVRRIAADSVAIILVEHVISAVRALCHHVTVMNVGVKIAEGTPEEVLRHPEVVAAYLGGDDA